VVIQKVPPHSTVVGVPGRVVSLRGQKLEGHELDHNLLPDPVLRRLEHLERDLARHAGAYAPRSKKKK
jgi:serine O-acetyltransferase